MGAEDDERGRPERPASLIFPSDGLRTQGNN